MDPTLKGECVGAVRRRYKLSWLLPFLPAIVEIVYKLVLKWVQERTPAQLDRAYAANARALAEEPL